MYYYKYLFQNVAAIHQQAVIKHTVKHNKSCLELEGRIFKYSYTYIYIYIYIYSHIILHRIKNIALLDPNRRVNRIFLIIFLQTITFHFGGINISGHFPNLKRVM